MEDHDWIWDNYCYFVEIIVCHFTLSAASLCLEMPFRFNKIQAILAIYDIYYTYGYHKNSTIASSASLLRSTFKLLPAVTPWLGWLTSAKIIIIGSNWIWVNTSHALHYLKGEKDLVFSYPHWQILSVPPMFLSGQHTNGVTLQLPVCGRLCFCVCMCVWVSLWVSERERERAREYLCCSEQSDW